MTGVTVVLGPASPGSPPFPLPPLPPLPPLVPPLPPDPPLLDPPLPCLPPAPSFESFEQADRSGKATIVTARIEHRMLYAYHPATSSSRPRVSHDSLLASSGAPGNGGKAFRVGVPLKQATV